MPAGICFEGGPYSVAGEGPLDVVGINTGPALAQSGLHIIINEKTSAMRSRISSKLIFASYVGYFDRAYYGFYVTSSRMLVLIEGDKI